MANIITASEIIPGGRVLIDGWVNEAVKIRVEENDAAGQSDRYLITFRAPGLDGRNDDRETRCTAGRKFVVAST